MGKGLSIFVNEDTTADILVQCVAPVSFLAKLVTVHYVLLIVGFTVTK